MQRATGNITRNVRHAAGNLLATARSAGMPHCRAVSQVTPSVSDASMHTVTAATDLRQRWPSCARIGHCSVRATKRQPHRDGVGRRSHKSVDPFARSVMVCRCTRSPHNACTCEHSALKA
jgi:hypothetical protein